MPCLCKPLSHLFPWLVALQPQHLDGFKKVVNLLFLHIVSLAASVYPAFFIPKKRPNVPQQFKESPCSLFIKFLHTTSLSSGGSWSLSEKVDAIRRECFPLPASQRLYLSSSPFFRLSLWMRYLFHLSKAHLCTKGHTELISQGSPFISIPFLLYIVSLSWHLSNNI